MTSPARRSMMRNPGCSSHQTSPNNTREELCSILKFRSTASPGKYLGFPIKHKSIPKDFGAVIEQVQNKLVGWKAHLLSFAGKLVLTQVTISAIGLNRGKEEASFN